MLAKDKKLNCFIKKTKVVEEYIAPKFNISSKSCAENNYFVCFNATKPEKDNCNQRLLTYLATGALPSADTRAFVDVDASSPVLAGRRAQGWRQAARQSTRC